MNENTWPFLLICGGLLVFLLAVSFFSQRYLLAHGFTEKDAWRGMNRVRKGQGLPTITDEMMEAKDKWKMARCERIEYLPAKSQILETLLFKIRSDRQST